MTLEMAGMRGRAYPAAALAAAVLQGPGVPRYQKGTKLTRLWCCQSLGGAGYQEIDWREAPRAGLEQAMACMER